MATTLAVLNPALSINNNNFISINFGAIFQSEKFKLINAETFFDTKQYNLAFDTYRELNDTNNLACINLGYLYSNGLGCVPNPSEACNKYKLLAENNSIEGLENYLAINLITTFNIDYTLEALNLGYKKFFHFYSCILNILFAFS